MKNKIRNSIVLAGLALFMTGCWQKSIHPFYKESDLMGDRRLAGSWNEYSEGKKKTATWTFSQQAEKELRLLIVDGDERYEFDARLFKLGETTLLDLFSRKRGTSEVPAHNLMKVALTNDSLDLSSMSIDWVRKWLTDHPTEIAHVRVNDPEEPANQDKMEFVLTAPTDELQKFVLAHKNAPGFFNDAMTFKREH